MADDLTYQKARRIRSTSFTDLLSDQLADAPTIRGAIKKTFSMKTAASVKGIKEKFDPLNIAKFLTGGSSLGPALLGRLTGRSERDIQYFSGRMRPIRDRGTASRLGREPGTGMSEGVNELLRRIYYLMQITRESDLERRDRELNYEEERRLEAEKRHRELLRALSGLSNTTATIVGGNGEPGLFDRIMSMLGDLFGNMPGMFGRFGRGAARGTGSLLRGLGSGVANVASFAMRFLTSPAFIIAAAPALLLAMAQKEKSEIEANPNDPKYDNNPYALSLRKGTIAGQEAKKNIRKASTQQETASRGEIQMALDENTPEAILIERYNADRVILQKWLNDPKNKIWKTPTTTMRVVTTGTTPPTNVPAGEEQRPTPTPAATPTQVQSTSENLKLNPSDGATGDQSTTPVNTATTPRAVTGTDLSSRLNAATNQNLDSNLPVKSPAPRTAVNNVVVPNQDNKMPQKLLDLKTIAVRNIEPTFLKMITDSTRVV